MSRNLPEVLSQEVAKLQWEPWEPAAPAHRLRLPVQVARLLGELGFNLMPILLSDIVQHTPPAYPLVGGGPPLPCLAPPFCGPSAPSQISQVGQDSAPSPRDPGGQAGGRACRASDLP